MKDKPKNQAAQVVALDGGRRDKARGNRSKEMSPEGANEEFAVLSMQDETLVLREFVLVGENAEGKRVLLTFNLSLDQFLAHVATITVVAHKRVEQVLDLE